MELLLIWIGLGFVAALAAQGRGRSFGLWLFLGLVFGVFALIAALVMPRVASATVSPSLPAYAATPQRTPPPAPRATMVDWYLEGDGDFDFEIVGESHRQEALAAVAGVKTEEGVDLIVDAIVRRDLHNAHDPNAIAVMIGGRLVGYIPRDDAAELAQMLHEKGMENQPVKTSAHIVGGWRRIKAGRVDEGSYGVRLDVAYPFALETASARRRRIASESDD